MSSSECAYLKSEITVDDFHSRRGARLCIPASSKPFDRKNTDTDGHLRGLEITCLTVYSMRRFPRFAGCSLNLQASVPIHHYLEFSHKKKKIVLKDF